ncbi:unnamed protein product [Allacma fusca]|uniref:N-terminal acetyltransferase B complex subunit NAA25 homolog n=1 Tax=Allacma fusca TaxID=39272 RepID=A0A8J2KIW2_9HEXA|nr:unnamed protein product [Allacma fusca]
MASGSKMHSDSVVKERRLRPIYELLDSSNNKRVVSEVDRLLKKQPNFTCAKVLKALALLRMGKTNECLAIISPVVTEVPTDENTIQALSICYRELDQPQMVCQILEQACKSEKNEDLLSNCFMAYTRVGDFQKQHQTALSLYKLYPKTPYFSWAIMSLYAKAERESDPLVTRVSLPLAERMMAKFIEDNKVETEHELTLYALILRKQQKYDKVLELLDTSFGKLQLSDCAGFYNKYKIDCLVSLSKHEELAHFMENNLRKNPDDYKSYAEYIRIFGETQTERVTNFLKEMRDEEKSDRSPLLAYLHLFQFLFDRGIDPKVGVDPISIFKQYAERFGNKPSFFMDLCGFLSGLQKDDAKEAFLAIMKDFIKTPIDYCKLNEIQRHVNYQYMSRFFSNRKQNNDPMKVMEYVQSNVEIYLDGNEAYETARKESLQTDDITLDEFIILACLKLVDSFWFDTNIWKGIFNLLQESKPKSLDNAAKEKIRNNLLNKYSSKVSVATVENDLNILNSEYNRTTKTDENSSSLNNDESANEEKDTWNSNCKLDSIIDTGKHSLSNGIARLLDSAGDKEYSICEEDFPVLLSMALLEHAVEKSPTSAQLRILLSKLYIRCGAVGAGADAIIALDLKHIQWESLGYLYIWKLTSSGFYHEATRILKLAESFYSSYQKESMEFVISAYKYGSWEKILEFMEFRDIILNSVQFGLLKVERQLLEYSKCASSRSQTIEVAQHSEISSNSLDFDMNYTESRDFSVLLTYSEEKVSEELIRKTYQADLQRIKVRGLMALLLDKLVLSQAENGFISNKAEIENLLSSFAREVEADYSEYDITQIPVDGMWPPRIFQYKEYGNLDLLLNMFNLTYSLGNGLNNIALSELFEKVTTKSRSMVLELIKLWSSSKHALLSRADRLESLYEFIETLGFCLILLEVSHTFINKSSSVNGKTRKKKSKENAAPDPLAQKNFNDVVVAFLDCLRKVEDVIVNFPFTSPEFFPVNWDSVSDYWSNFVNQDLLTYILPHAIPTVMRKLNLSYERSISDLSSNIKWKIEHLEGIAFAS